jgi:hypothetical protein
MRRIFWHYCVAIIIVLFTAPSFGLVIPTNNKSVDLWLGLFGSASNPAQRIGCYNNVGNVFTGKQLIEYHYTAMDCADSVDKIAAPGVSSINSEASSITDEDLMQHVLSRVTAFQLGLNFSFNS